MDGVCYSIYGQIWLHGHGLNWFWFGVFEDGWAVRLFPDLNFKIPFVKWSGAGPTFLKCSVKDGPKHELRPMPMMAFIMWQFLTEPLILGFG